MFDRTELTLSVTVEVYRSDAVFGRLRSEGLDERTLECLRLALEQPELSALAYRTRDRYTTLPGLMDALQEFSTPSTALAPSDVDLLFLVKYAASVEDDGLALARAILGLFALAVLEGLAKSHRRAAYPFISVNAIQQVALPVSQWLAQCGAHWSAGVLAQLLREGILSDPYQRISGEGRTIVAELRRIEAESQNHLRGGCREVAWLLHKDFDRYRLFVAALFFAVGDPVRAFAIAGTERHKPALRVLIDLVEVSITLSAVDPLLQAVWLFTLGETQIPVPDDIRFILRRIMPEVNSEFKGADEALRKYRGLSFSDAYAWGVVSYFAGLWDDSSVTSVWLRILKEAFTLPTFQPHYRSGFLRLLELYSLATPPGTPLPSSEFVAALAGIGPQPSDDLRDVARVSLQMDQWTSRRAQVGRSLAYDSAFYVEPWRRNESVEESVNFLELHRFAAIKYWLTVVPPLCRPPRGRRQRRIVERDQQLMWQYRSIAFLTAIAGGPIYLQLYGGPEFKRLLKVDANSFTRYLTKCDEQFADLRRDAAKEFPEYAEERFCRAATFDEIRRVLGIG